MSCNEQTSNDNGDKLECNGEHRPFDWSATAWLIGQGVQYLNTADKEGELAYLRIVELLRCCGRELLNTVIRLYRQAGVGDAMLRWNLLCILGDTGDRSAAEFLVGSALAPIPEAAPDQGCEGPRDMEMLIRTMAVHALHRIAERNPEASEALLNVVSGHPIRPILIEAIKCAHQLGLKERVQELLPKDDHWMLDIRRARIEEVFADPERTDGKERGFTPPRSGDLYTAPKIGCCTR